MDRVLLDTDIFSEVLKGIDPQVVTQARRYHATFGHYTISVITIMEIAKGLHKMRREERLTQFLDSLTGINVLALDVQAAELAGRIYADLERVGQPIGRADPMIAAIALHHDLTLITGNQRHYQRIQSAGYKLRLDNWR
jgi:tRNA(fMet)-specific endonuclease VapC